MEIVKISSQIENPLFSRKEIVIEIKNETSPKKIDVEKILSEKFSASADSIKIEKIVPKFGSDIFTIHSKIYNSKKELDETEFVKKKKGDKK